MKVENPRKTTSGWTHQVSFRDVSPNRRTGIVICTCSMLAAPLNHEATLRELGLVLRPMLGDR